MTMRPGRGALRLARTLCVTVPSVLLGVATHATAGGCVSAIGVLLILCIFGTATWTQLSRERSAPFLVVWLPVGQLLGHGLLELTCNERHAPAAGATARMLGLHAAAVVVTALVLAAGERWVWALARRLSTLHTFSRRLLRRLLAFDEPPTAPPADRTSPAVGVDIWHDSPWTSLRPVRRGPPRVA